jgi:hypothetical protein
LIVSRPRSIRAALLAAIGLGVVISTLLIVLLVSSSSLDVQFVDGDAARAEMDRLRARLPSQVSCVDRGAVDTSQAAATGRPRPRMVHMLAWEREDERLVRISTPYWALRIAGVKLNAARLIAPALEHVTLVDLERCGHGLIVDRATAGGGRVVIWTE